MFTQNYISFRLASFLGQGPTDSYANKTSCPVKTTSGFEGYCYGKYGAELGYSSSDIGAWMLTGRCQEIPTSYYSVAQISSRNPSNSMYPGVYFGTGSTPANLADHTLQSPITSGLTITNPSRVLLESEKEGQYTLSASYVLTNATEAELNIYEMGVVTPALVGGQYGSCLYPVLMERTVLTEPITIPPGASKLVTYKITFNQTLNVD